MMGVFIAMRMKVDPERLCQVLINAPERWGEVNSRARENGCLHHRFLTNGEGTVLVADEWSSREAFEKFFPGNKDIQELMREAGVQSEPEITFWQPMDTPDSF